MNTTQFKDEVRSKYPDSYFVANKCGGISARRIIGEKRFLFWSYNTTESVGIWLPGFNNPINPGQTVWTIK